MSEPAAGRSVPVFRGDIWDLYARGDWLVDPTNAFVKTNGQNVMGRGISLQVAARFPDVPTTYGATLLTATCPRLPAGRQVADADLTGSLVADDAGHRLIFLVVKRVWREPADLGLIARGLADLGAWLRAHPADRIALPRLGCGNGGRDWVTEVRPLVVDFLRTLEPAEWSRVTLVSPARTD